MGRGAGAGWAAGSSWEHLHEDLRVFDYLVVAAVLAGIGLLAWKLVRRRRAA